MSSSNTLDPRQLLSEAAWLQSLARQLVRDPAAAEDAAQQTMLLLSEKQADQQPSRRWLASVLRNFLRQEKRSQKTRQRLENAAAKKEATDPSDEVASRLEIQRQLIEAVQALDEPYRSTISLRFLESKPPREVARRMGVPVKTVHTRIERGLARLRSKLDRSYRGRSEWLSVLTPLTLRHAAWGVPGLGVLVMSSTVKWTASVLGVLVLGWFLQQNLGIEELPAEKLETEQALSSTLALEEQEDIVEAASSSTARQRLAPTASAAEETAAETETTFAGRVVDPNGLAVAGITVKFEDFDRRDFESPTHNSPGESDASGAFRMSLPIGRGRLIGQGNGYGPVFSPGISGIMPVEPPQVVVGPERAYGGRVIDEQGRPMTDVELDIVLAEEVAHRLQPGGLSGIVPVARTKTNAKGRFNFASIGFVEGSAISAEVDGYEIASLDLPSFSSEELELILEKKRVDGNMLAGRVIDQQGSPVPGAHVSAGQSTTTSDAQGKFVLERQAKNGKILRAVAKGTLPAAVSIEDMDARAQGEITLQLGASGKTITGQVLDAEGKPIANAQVWTFDGEHFGFVPERFGEVEFMLSKAVEEMIAGERRDGRSGRSKADGSFELSGLADRKYGLYAMHPQNLSLGQASSVDAGSAGINIHIHDSELRAPVAGRVINYAGEPVEGALIRVSRTFMKADGGLGYRGGDHAFHATTDAKGFFRFADLVIEGTSLLLNGEMVSAPQTIALDEVADLEQVEFLMPASCHIRVLLQSDANFARAFELLDAKGEKLHLSFMRGGVNLGAQSVGIENGESPLTQTDESAVTIVLYGDQGTEVHRESISLKAGEVNEIRF